MKIVFIYSGAENIGIESISSFLKARGHEVHLLFDPAVFWGDTLINSKLLARYLNIDNAILRNTIALNPDMVAFSAYTGNYRWCLKIAKSVKAQVNVPILFGGIHPTSVPDVVLANDCVDYVIIGEGEHATLELLEGIKNGGKETLTKIPNLCMRLDGKTIINPPRPYIKDLDSLPMPDRGLFFDKVPILEEQFLMMTSRGCPYTCTYCTNDMLHATYCNEKQHVRRRSPENVIEELSWYYKRGRMKSINFADDIFTISKDWLEVFVEQYRAKIGLPFVCLAHPATINQDVVRLLKEGNCYLISLGIQSGSERIRKIDFDRHGSDEKILEAIGHIKDAGLKLTVDNIFGAPSETDQDILDGLEFYKQVKPDRIMTFWLTFFPRTSIIQKAKMKGTLTDEDIRMIDEGHSGFAHSTGSIRGEERKKYLEYEVLFQLTALFHNEKHFRWAAKLARIFPFKKLATRVVFVLNAVKNRDFKILNGVRYIFAKKNTP
ncbi:MAG: cobalamin-dependent protein [Anaerolineales bacterium]|nr:cobalamin-dependent protein [Anaerolineales bacterium]